MGPRGIALPNVEAEFQRWALAWLFGPHLRNATKDAPYQTQSSFFDLNAGGQLAHPLSRVNVSSGGLVGLRQRGQ